MSLLVHDHSGLSVNGSIELRVFSPAHLRREIKAWDALDRGQKHERVRQLGADHAEQVAEVGNIALDGLLEFIPQALDPTSDAAATASHLALGDGGSTAADPGGESLNNEVYRIIVGDADTDGPDLLASAYLSQIEANGYVIREIGLAGGPSPTDDRLLTHAVLDEADYIEKNGDMVATFNYVLEFRRPA